MSMPCAILCARCPDSAEQPIHQRCGLLGASPPDDLDFDERTKRRHAVDVNYGKPDSHSQP
jgi:hypothetical protein